MPNVDTATPVGVAPSVLLINQSREVLVTQGPTQTTIYKLQAPSDGTDQTVFNVNLPANQILDPRIYFACTLEFKFVPKNPTGTKTVLLGQSDAIRNMPIHYGATTINMVIAGQTFTIAASRLIQGLSWKIHNKDRQFLFSATGAMNDQYQEYNDFQQWGSAKNALGKYGENSYEMMRYNGLYREIVNDQNGATVEVDIIEPICLSPLLFTNDIQTSGFAGLQNIQFQFSWNQALVKLWSRNAAIAPQELADANPVSVKFKGNPYLYYTLYTPNPLVAPYLISSIYTYPSFKIQSVDTNTGEIEAFSNPASTVAQFTVNAFTLATVPTLLYVWLEEKPENMDIYKTNTFARINSISLQFNNGDQLFSTASSWDLWRMSAHNGSTQTYPQWAKFTGSVLVLKFGWDIPLPAGQSTGMMGNNTIGLTVNFTNLKERKVSYVCRVVYMMPQSFQVNNGVSGSVTDGIVDPAQVAQATASGTIMSEPTPSQPFSGGGNYYAGGTFGGGGYSGGGITIGGAGPPVLIGGSFLGDLWGRVKKIGRAAWSNIKNRLPGFVRPAIDAGLSAGPSWLKKGADEFMGNWGRGRGAGFRGGSILRGPGGPGNGSSPGVRFEPNSSARYRFMSNM